MVKVVVEIAMVLVLVLVLLVMAVVLVLVAVMAMVMMVDILASGIRTLCPISGLHFWCECECSANVVQCSAV